MYSFVLVHKESGHKDKNPQIRLQHLQPGSYTTIYS